VGIRIRPEDVEVPPDNPFANDRLEREPHAQILTNILRGIEGPCVLAIDAPWGAGKTVFLRMWAAHLRREGFSVADFNAWETDFAAEPFAALTSELEAGLAPEPGSKAGKALKKAKTAAVDVLRHAVPGAIRLATAGVLDVSSLLESEAGNVLADLAEERMAKYEKGKASISAFRRRLSELAEALAENSEGLPLVIIVDELDRCRPIYAIELLESAKHLFSVDGVAFVVALDRSELAHSIRSIYGSGFDAPGYLRRFVDVDYTLPVADRTRFIQALIEASHIPEYFKRTLDRDGKEQQRSLNELLVTVLGASSVALRDIAQGIHRLGLVLASLPNDRRSFALSATALIVLRVLDPTGYKELVSGRMKDGDLLDQLFSDPALSKIRDQHVGRLFEALTIVGVDELGWTSTAWPRMKALCDEVGEADKSPPWHVQHARAVTALVERLGQIRPGEGRLGFKPSLQRIELLSGESTL